MNEQGPGLVDSTILFKSIFSTAPEVRGGICKELDVSYLYDGPLLTAYNVNDGQPLAQHNFNTDSVGSGSGEPPSILCVQEFNKWNLLVGMDSGDGQGMVVLLNLPLNKVIRRISMPAPVTAVEVLETNGEKERALLAGVLKNFHGVACCGTKTGGVYVIDLSLDCELDGVTLLSTYNISIDEEQLDRSARVSSYEVLCVPLDCTENPDYFCYQGPSGDVKHMAQPDEVFVSCLKFIPQLATLCVGYNFGAFQLWRVDPLCLDYASPVETDELAVSHFTYQEPENDPRSFCYIWVARCVYLSASVGLSTSLDEFISGSVASISLYQLAYESKDFAICGQVIFNDLAQVGCAFQHRLSPDCEVMTSWVVSCGTLSNVKSLKAPEDDSQIDVSPVDTNMAQFSWRVRHMDGAVTSHLAIFDINRWYHAQMPPSIRVVGGWSSFFSQYSFDEIILNKECLDVRIDTKTIVVYKCPSNSKQERFQYPCSLSFYAYFLTSESCTSICYFGLQRQTLHTIINIGSETILKPAEAFDSLINAGLISNRSRSAEVQRRAILTVLLSHAHIPTILKFISCVAKLGPSKCPCDLNFVSQWLWGTLQDTVRQFDQKCIRLYDWSGILLEEQDRRELISLKMQCSTINFLLKRLVEIVETNSGQVVEDSLSEKIEVLNCRLVNMTLVEWMIENRLLPESGLEGSSHNGLFNYPVSAMRRAYNNRQSELLLLKSSVGTKQQQLIVDKLMKNVDGLTDLFKDEGGSSQYPPPNLRALLNIFLLSGDYQSHLSLFIYTMLDLIALMDTTTDELSTQFHYLLVSLNVCSEKDKYFGLYHTILAYWYYDHKDFDDVATALCQPGACRLISPDDAADMLGGLLAQAKPKCALEVLEVMEKSGECIIAKTDIIVEILLANGDIKGAMLLSRKYEAGSEKLFKRVLDDIGIGQGLSNLLCMPLDVQELSHIRAYLEQKGDLDKFVVHLLQMGDISEAVKIDHALKSQPLWRSDIQSKKRSAVREKLVQWYCKELPPIQQKLLNDPSYLGLRQRTKYIKPTNVWPNIISKPKKITPVELAKSIYDKQSTQASPNGALYKPFVETLTPAAKRMMGSRTAPVMKIQRRSITGLFDSQSKSPTKRRKPFEDGGPERKLTRGSSGQGISRSAVKNLLRTPLIKRKSPRRAHTVGPTMAPHSILKVRKPQILISPSIAQSPTLLQNKSRDSLIKSAPKSVSKVRWQNLSLEDSTDQVDDEVDLNKSHFAPQLICFDDDEEEEDDEDADGEIIFQNPNLSNQSASMNDSESFQNRSSIEPTEEYVDLNKSERPVIDLTSDEEMDSFASAESGSPTTNKQEGATHSQTSPTSQRSEEVEMETEQSTADFSLIEVKPLLTPEKPSMSTLEVPSTPVTELRVTPERVVSGSNSPSSASSARSLSLLDKEARLSGLPLQRVRQEEINKERRLSAIVHREFLFDAGEPYAEPTASSRQTLDTFEFSHPAHIPESPKRSIPRSSHATQTLSPDSKVKTKTPRRSEKATPTQHIKPVSSTALEHQSSPIKKPAAETPSPDGKIKTAVQHKAEKTTPTKHLESVSSSDFEYQTSPIKEPATETSSPDSQIKAATPHKTEKTTPTKHPEPVLSSASDHRIPAIKDPETQAAYMAIQVFSPVQIVANPKSKSQVVSDTFDFTGPPSAVNIPADVKSTEKSEESPPRSERILEQAADSKGSQPPHFYFSPVATVTREDTPNETAVDDQNFLFSEPSDARAVLKKKPLRPFKVTLPEGMFDSPTTHHTKLTKTQSSLTSRVRMSVQRYTTSTAENVPEIESVTESDEASNAPEKRARGRKPIRPFKVTLPDGMFDDPPPLRRSSRQKNKDSENKAPKEPEPRNARRTPTRRAKKVAGQESEATSTAPSDPGTTDDEGKAATRRRAPRQKAPATLQEKEIIPKRSTKISASLAAKEHDVQLEEKDETTASEIVTLAEDASLSSGGSSKSQRTPKTKIPTPSAQRSTRGRKKSESDVVSETGSDTEGATDDDHRVRASRRTRQTSLPPVPEGSIIDPPTARRGRLRKTSMKPVEELVLPASRRGRGSSELETMSEPPPTPRRRLRKNSETESLPPSTPPKPIGRKARSASTGKKSVSAPEPSPQNAQGSVTRSTRSTRASRLSPILSPSALEQVLKTPRSKARRKL